MYNQGTSSSNYPPNLNNKKNNALDYICLDENFFNIFNKIPSEAIKEILKNLDNYLNKTKLRRELFLGDKVLPPFNKAIDSKKTHYRIIFKITVNGLGNILIHVIEYYKLNYSSAPYFNQQKINEVLLKIEDDNRLF